MPTIKNITTLWANSADDKMIFAEIVTQHAEHLNHMLC